MMQINSSVYAAPLNDGLALLNVETGIYFGLDPVGASIWELLNEGMSLSGIAERLVQEYDVEREVLETDIAALVATLQEHGLVHTLNPRHDS
jgi:hypothetical protein